MNNLQNLFVNLHLHPIAYYPVYRKLTGSTTAGILLSQLMFWWAKVQGRKFYKTDSEIMEETYLTAEEFKTAKARLRLCRFVIITREGLPAKTFYDIDPTTLFESINQVCGNGTNCDVGMAQTGVGNSIKQQQENTTKNTQYTTSIEESINSILKLLNELSGRQLPIEGDRAATNILSVKKLLDKKYSVEEIKDVVQLKCFEWVNNPDMFQYLHPTTIFRLSNFQKYLDCLNDLKSNPEKAEKFKKSINGKHISTTDIFPDATKRAVLEELHAEGFFDS